MIGRVGIIIRAVEFYIYIIRRRRPNEESMNIFHFGYLLTGVTVRRKLLKLSRASLVSIDPYAVYIQPFSD